MVTEDQLASWTTPSSATEQDKQERTERMIREAIDSHPGFDGYRRRFSVYAKGSYANNTNVKADSDVDITVECSDAVYWRNQDAAKPGYEGGEPYSGIWTPDLLRSEVLHALNRKFPDAVNEGGTSFEVHSGSARVNADVVPSFTFRLYYASGAYAQGLKIFKRDGTSIENYPQQQINNGAAKNSRTHRRYKRTVRILKRLENTLVDRGLTDPVPSYLLECLVYNCPDESFMGEEWTAIVRSCLAKIFNHTRGGEEQDGRWLESNGIKYLFQSSQKWTIAQSHKFASDAWDYMGFDG